MSIADEAVSADSLPKPSPPGSIGMNLFTMAILVVLIILSALLVVVYGAAGWATRGWVGLIGGIAIGIVLIPAAFVGVWVGFLLLVKVLIFVFSIGPEDFQIDERAAEPEGSEPANRPLSRPRPRPSFRPVVILSATAAVWAIYGLPALRNAGNSHEVWQAIQFAVILPLGFIGLVARHWLAARWLVVGRPPPTNRRGGAFTTDHTEHAEK